MRRTIGLLKRSGFMAFWANEIQPDQAAVAINFTRIGGVIGPTIWTAWTILRPIVIPSPSESSFRKIVWPCGQEMQRNKNHYCEHERKKYAQTHGITLRISGNWAMSCKPKDYRNSSATAHRNPGSTFSSWSTSFSRNLREWPSGVCTTTSRDMG